MADLILKDTDPNELRAAIAADVLAAIRPLLANSSAPRLVDGDRMAELAGVSRPTIDRLVRDQRVPSVKIGSRRLFAPQAVIDALAAATIANEKGPVAAGPESVPTREGGYRHDSNPQA